jgi:hypothetical protein
MKHQAEISSFRFQNKWGRWTKPSSGLQPQHNCTNKIINPSVTWAQARTKQQGLIIAFQLFYKIK